MSGDEKGARWSANASLYACTLSDGGVAQPITHLSRATPTLKLTPLVGDDAPWVVVVCARWMLAVWVVVW